MPDPRGLQVGIGLAAGVFAWALLGALRRRVSPEHYRNLVWLVAGGALALLPVLSSFITTRLVLPASIGAAALMGSALAAAIYVLLDVWQLGASARSMVAPGAAALFVLFVHGYGALEGGRATTELYSRVAQARSEVPELAEIDDARSAQQRVILVAAADANDAPYLPFVRFAGGMPLTKGFRLLSGAPSPHALQRIDAHTIELTVLDPRALAGSVVGSLTRGRGDALQVGQRFALPGMTVDVLELLDGQPLRTRVAFDVPLEHESLLWLESGPRGLRKLQLPQIGERALIAAPVLPEIAALLAAH
jgi:hypothetical protein